MLAIRLTLLFAAVNIIAPVAGPLRVIRVTPETPADPLAEVTVTFDRPVAGGLDASVNAEAVFRIDPAIDGRLEWRDPLTIRFTPDRPLTPGHTYTVTVLPGFSAMDGAALEEAFTRSFRVAPPRVLGADPVSGIDLARNLPPSPVFRVLVSAPVDATTLAARARIQLARECGAASVGLIAAGQHRIGPDDPPRFRWLGVRRQPADSMQDLRRVVELRPASELPLDCAGSLRLPVEIDGDNASTTTWTFRTYGPFRADSVACAFGGSCPGGPVRVRFTTPVSGEQVVRSLRIMPASAFTVRDTSGVSTEWILDTSLSPRTAYSVVVDPGLTDVFGQSFEGPAVHSFRTTGYAPSISYEYGRMLVEKEGLRTLAVQHVNVDTLYVRTIVVPDSMERMFLSREWGWDEPWSALVAGSTLRKVQVRSGRDERLVSGVRMPASEPRPGGSLIAIQVSAAALDSTQQRHRPIALVQVTNLAVHARIATDRGMVWVTNVDDGLPREGVNVEVRDANGDVRGSGRTNADGIVAIADLAGGEERTDCCWGFEGYVVAFTDDDRALVGINEYDPDLSPWRFGVYGAWEMDREPAAATAFTERGIYRPGETVHAKAIVRAGALGSLRSPAGDSMRWTFRDRERNALRDTVIALSEFGTSHASLTLPASSPLGWYSIAIDTKLRGEWTTLDEATYQVAEYRPPEFLVDAVGPSVAAMSGDTASFTVGGRYLFGAPMAHSPVDWNLRVRSVSYGTAIPGAEGYTVGGASAWWERGAETGVQIVARGIDTLDVTGSTDLRVALPPIEDGRPATATLVASVTDANRQTVSAAATVTVHPASVYIGARTTGNTWFWQANQPVTIELIAVRPDGERVNGVDIAGTIVRREWHRVRRVRNGQVEQVGGWVTDTVATCTVRSREAPSPCSFTPPGGGSYSVTFTARDEQGRFARTSMYRWASGPDWVPWNDESQLNMDVITDRPTYDVGDTATVFFASPFTDAEAWVTVEREHVIESRRIRIDAGATTMKLPITEALAPNVYVSIVVVRGRSAEPGPLDDPGRPTLRVGYAQLRVLPGMKRLAVAVTPVSSLDEQGNEEPSASQPSNSQQSDSPASTGASSAAALVEYEPGDTATVRVRVTDSNGQGARAEVTLWAVDEGVLALTGYTTPDPVSLIYRERGLGSRLASNLTGVAAQVPDGQKGRREAGGGGGDGLAGILRSRFRTTAFFLGSVVTDAEGNAVARAGLPDNLTTFRVMAVAVTAGDRYGSGESSFLVTRPLVARPALPRFVRPGDRFDAGVIVNSRTGEARDVQVEATVTGIDIDGGNRKRERLAPGRGVDVRFRFEAERGDSATFQFDARSGDDRDAVRLSVPVRPDYHPLAATIAGAVRDTTTAVFTLRDDIDADRSTVTIGFGSSVFAIIEGARQNLRVYPYYCTEQLSSMALPIVALYRARLQLGMEAEVGELADQLQSAVQLLSRRQGPSGGIGYWSASDWSSPWLSSYAGRVLLEARDAGMAVDSAVLAGLADYLRRSLVDESYLRTPVAWWYTETDRMLTEKVAAAGFLSRYGQPDAATENTLLQQASRLRWEDRLALAEMLQRRGEHASALLLVDRAWEGVRMEGRHAVLPEAAHQAHYFRSDTRPAARLLTATLAVRPDHPGVGPLAETLIERGRARNGWIWNTQDYGWAVLALAEFEQRRTQAGPASLTVRGRRGDLLTATVQPGGRVTVRDSTIPLNRLVERDADGNNILRLGIAADAQGPAASPYWFFLTVHEVPDTRPVDPVDRGIVVERWYETVESREPITSIGEGELVRVKLRVTVPAERHFIVLDDPLPAGLEPVDLSLRTVAPLGAVFPEYRPEYESSPESGGWYYGSWDAGMWSPFDHRELRDDRVVYSASVLWHGSYTATYIARATTAGTFIVPPAHAEEMYNPGVNGRTGGTTFTVTRVQR